MLLEPAYWSIGKIARYLDPDVDDLVRVFKKQRVPALKLAKLWGKALAKSPRSSASFSFKKHVEHFLELMAGLFGVMNSARISIFWCSMAPRVLIV